MAWKDSEPTEFISQSVFNHEYTEYLHILKQSTSPDTVYDITDWMCRLMSYRYLIPIKAKDLIASKILGTPSNLDHKINYNYLRFVFNNDLIYKICISKVQDEQFDFVGIQHYSCQILRFVVQHPLTPKKIKNMIVDKLTLAFNVAEIYQKMKIADIVLIVNPTVGNRMLNELRREQGLDLDIPNFNHNNPSVLTDTQNVHNSKVNENVNKITKIFVQNNPSKFTLEKVFEDPIFNHNELQEIYNRISIDTALFGGIRISQFFCSLYTYAQSHPLKEDLFVRLKQEMLDMKKYCSTGYISRLVSVLVGFDDTEKQIYTIKICDFDEWVIKISYILKTKIESHPEAMDWMIDDDTRYLRLVVETVNKSLVNYPDIDLKDVSEFIRKYTGKVVKINEGKISI